MRILLGNNHLHTLGGTETHVYAMTEAFSEMGHQVDVITPEPGFVSELLTKNFGCRVNNNLQTSYDRIILNHTSAVATAKKYFDEKQIWQICHGTIHPLEHPAPGVNHIAITPEVQDFIASRGYSSKIILNPIDCRKFAPVNKISEKLETVFSLAQDENFNNLLAQICAKLGLKFAKRNKFVNPTFDVNTEMQSADLVVSLGRGCYESMASAKSVLVADQRWYQGGIMDGIVKPDTFEHFLQCNCSGRSTKQAVTEDAIVAELEKYSADDGVINRMFATELFDSRKIAQQYLELTA